MGSATVTLLYFIPTIVSGLFLVAALAFVLVKRSTCPAAANLATLGLLILLVLQVGGYLVNFLIARSFETETIVFANGIVYILRSLLHCVGLGLVIAAVFARRTPEDASSFEAVASAGDNPYAPTTR